MWQFKEAECYFFYEVPVLHPIPFLLFLFPFPKIIEKPLGLWLLVRDPQPHCPNV
jgi:hypothetical protein